LSPRICIGIRTYPKHYRYIQALLQALVAQHRDSEYRAIIGLKLFVVNTDVEAVKVDTESRANSTGTGTNGGSGGNPTAPRFRYTKRPQQRHRKRHQPRPLQDYSEVLRAYADTINHEHDDKGAELEHYIHVLTPHFAADPPSASAAAASASAVGKQFYGYELTDLLLEHMLAEDLKCGKSVCLSVRLSLSNVMLINYTIYTTWTVPVLCPCLPISMAADWVMFTNGDNMYGRHWLDSVASTVLGSIGSHQLQQITATADMGRGGGWEQRQMSSVLHVHADAGSMGKHRKPVVDVIAWDFVTHHSRRIARTRGGAIRRRHQTISVDVRRRVWLIWGV